MYVHSRGVLLLPLSLVLLFGFVMEFSERLSFLQASKKTDAIVVDLKGFNYERRRILSGKYTYFSASIEYFVEGKKYNLTVKAGRIEGFDQPMKYADYKMGQTLKILYDYQNPNTAYVDTFWNIWGKAFMALLLSTIGFLCGIRWIIALKRDSFI